MAESAASRLILARIDVGAAALDVRDVLRIELDAAMVRIAIVEQRENIVV